MTRISEYALTYAYRGHPVLPLRGKVPILQHGLQEASAHPSQIREWWQRWPDANIGVRCSHAYVLDVDPRHGGDERLAAMAKQHPHVPCPLVRTGSGGYHLWWAPVHLAEGETLRRHPLEGCDGCGPGHYVVVPPSVHPDTGQPYRWVRRLGSELPVMPAWLRALVVRPPSAPAPPSDPLTGDVELRARRYVERMGVSVSGQGGHRAAWVVACKLVHGFGLRDEAALEVMRDWNRGCQPPWSERELTHKIQSARRDAGELARAVEERARR